MAFAGAFLNPTDQFIMLAVNILEIVIRERGPLLFQFALGDIPVTFDFEFVHGLKATPSTCPLPWGQTLL
jgi:hypothetical protein